MFGKKKQTASQIQKESGIIPKHMSYIMAVPETMGQVGGPYDIVARLKEAAAFHLVSYKVEEQGALQIILDYQSQEYHMELFPEPLELPELFTINHRFTKDGISAMQNAETGITSSVEYGEDVLKSYHLQLKVLDCAVPDMIGLVDFCSERILSGLWAHMAAQSDIPPAPLYLYSIQAVSGDEDSGDGVWLHTHGLNRCGSIDLEILNVDKEYFQNEAAVIQTVAGNIITKGPLGGELEGFWVSSFPEGQMLIATWVYWRTALREFYPSLGLGGWDDREEAHNEDTGVLLCYPDGESYEKKEPVPIGIFDIQLEENPLLMISSEETERMKKLAEERFGYFRSEVGREGVTGIIKFGMPVDEEYREEDSANLEHLWFEIMSIDGDKVHCKRTQDAYYIKELNRTDECDIGLEQLTDWILYTPDAEVTPDSVYLLEQYKMQ